MIYEIFTVSIIILFEIPHYKCEMSYSFIHEFARVVSHNESAFNFTSFNFYKPTRTKGALNFSIVMSDDITLENDFILKHEYMKYVNNEYRRTALNFELRMCEILSKGIFAAKEILKYSDMKECPISKGHHYIYKMSPSTDGWPRFLPEGKFMIQVTFHNNNGFLAKIQWMVQILKNI